MVSAFSFEINLIFKIQTGFPLLVRFPLNGPVPGKLIIQPDTLIVDMPHYGGISDFKIFQKSLFCHQLRPTTLVKTKNISFYGYLVQTQQITKLGTQVAGYPLTGKRFNPTGQYIGYPGT